MAFKLFRGTVTLYSMGETFKDYQKLNDEIIFCLLCHVSSALLCCNKKPNDIMSLSTQHLMSLTIFACNTLHFFMPNQCSINKCYLTYALVVLLATG